jgi:hypothetical protein
LFADAVKDTLPLLSVLTTADKVKFVGATSTLELFFLLQARRRIEIKKERDINFMFVIFSNGQCLSGWQKTGDPARGRFVYCLSFPSVLFHFQLLIP